MQCLRNLTVVVKRKKKECSDLEQAHRTGNVQLTLSSFIAGGVFGSLEEAAAPLSSLGMRGDADENALSCDFLVRRLEGELRTEVGGVTLDSLTEERDAEVLVRRIEAVRRVPRGREDLRASLEVSRSKMPRSRMPY